MKLTIILYGSLVVMLSSSQLYSTEVLRGPKSFKEVLDTVVLVKTDTQAGSGLLWQKPGQIVTALHVVAGFREMIVTYNVAGASVERKAEFVCCIPDRDLALLRLQKDQQLPDARYVFNSATEPLTEGDDVYAMGYPLSILDPELIFLKVKKTSATLRSILPIADRNELEGTFLGLDRSVISLQGPLISGLSGCPVGNKQFQLVGIGQGGLEGGHIGRCWAIPGADLAGLNTDTCSKVLPSSLSRDTLFGVASSHFLDLQTIDPEAIRLDCNGSRQVSIGGSAKPDVMFVIFVKEYGRLGLNIRNLNPRGVSGSLAGTKLKDMGQHTLDSIRRIFSSREATLGPAYVNAGHAYFVRIKPLKPAILVQLRIEAKLEPIKDVGERYEHRDTARDISQVRTITDTVGFGRNRQDCYRIIAPGTGTFSILVQNQTPKGTKNGALAGTDIEFQGHRRSARRAGVGRESSSKPVMVNSGDEIMIRVTPLKDFHAAPYRLQWFLQ